MSRKVSWTVTLAIAAIILECTCFTARNAEPGPAWVAQFCLIHIAVFFVANLVPASATAWASASGGFRRAVVIDALALAASTVAIELLAQEVWRRSVPPAQVRIHVSEMFAGSLLVGFASMPLVRHAVCDDLVFKWRTLFRDASFSLVGGAAAVGWAIS